MAEILQKKMLKSIVSMTIGIFFVGQRYIIGILAIGLKNKVVSIVRGKFEVLRSAYRPSQYRKILIFIANFLVVL